MTAQQAAKSEPASPKNAVRLDGLQKIRRARRLEAAARSRPAQKRKHWRNQALVSADKKTDERKHQGARIEARSARRNHSSFSSRKVARAAGGRAITTSQNPSRIRACCVRTISRSRRRIRFRTTAPPTRLEVMKPICHFCASSTFRKPIISNAPLTVRPSRRTRANCAVSASRRAFGNVSDGCSEFTGEIAAGVLRLSYVSVQQKSSRRLAAGRLCEKTRRSTTESGSKSLWSCSSRMYRETTLCWCLLSWCPWTWLKSPAMDLRPWCCSPSLPVRIQREQQFRFFVRKLQGARRWQECRLIFSYLWIGCP